MVNYPLAFEGIVESMNLRIQLKPKEGVQKSEEELERGNEAKKAILSIAVPAAIIGSKYSGDSGFIDWLYPRDENGLHVFNQAVLDEAALGFRYYESVHSSQVHQAERYISEQLETVYDKMTNAGLWDTLKNPALRGLRFKRELSRLSGTVEAFDELAKKAFLDVSLENQRNMHVDLHCPERNLAFFVEKQRKFQTLFSTVMSPHNPLTLDQLFYGWEMRFLEDNERDIYQNARAWFRTTITPLYFDKLKPLFPL